MLRVTKTLELARGALAQTLDWQEALDIFFASLQEVGSYRKIQVLMWDATSRSFIVEGGQCSSSAALVISSDHPLALYASKIKAPLLYGKLPPETPLEVQQAFDWLAISALLPLVVQDEVVGIVLLEEPLGSSRAKDVKVLAELAMIAAPALHHAFLYRTSLKEVVQLNRELEQKIDSLAAASGQKQDLDLARSEFLSIASHQLYTPLTAIRGYLSMLQEGDFGRLPTKQQPIIDIVGKSATRLIALIRNLLDISRIESGRFELNLAMVNIVEAAQESVQDLLPNAINKGLQLVFTKPSTPILLLVGDQQRLRQVMLNFIDNAIKYTDQGTIDVRVEQQDEHELVFSVTDTGKGLSQAQIPLLFTKFSRVGGAGIFNTEGTGLGLYVAEQIVREHRGDVLARSPGPGQGSTFSVTLPLSSSPRSLKLGDTAIVEIKQYDADT